MAELSWHEAIVEVLEEAKEPLHYTRIAEEIALQELRHNLGATPATSVASVVSTSLNSDGDRSPFERVSRGVYRLRGQTPTTAQDPLPSSEDEPDLGLINAFGMYWLRDRVFWEKPNLLGQQQQGSNCVDFSEQRGVYLLHDRREVIYVGRATDQAMGKRLRQHTTDRLGGRWDRFSWFGVLTVTPEGTLASGSSETYNIENLIATLEALLIEGLEPRQNRKRGDGFSAVEFIQVVDPEIEKKQQRLLMEKLKSKL